MTTPQNTPSRTFNPNVLLKQLTEAIRKRKENITPESIERLNKIKSKAYEDMKKQPSLLNKLRTQMSERREAWSKNDEDE